MDQFKINDMLNLSPTALIRESRPIPSRIEDRTAQSAAVAKVFTIIKKRKLCQSTIHTTGDADQLTTSDGAGANAGTCCDLVS
jgi:hypothetical protein